MFSPDFPTDKLSQITAKHESVRDGTKFAQNWSPKARGNRISLQQLMSGWRYSKP
ncbi:hypothetical protein SBDP1_540040 [Syntrophobacter sp. SbD1]|nr:hypothetical protein SBDP1_540040 [Syntrophobacter sp. SbD1]